MVASVVASGVGREAIGNETEKMQADTVRALYEDGNMEVPR